MVKEPSALNVSALQSPADFYIATKIECRKIHTAVNTGTARNVCA